MDKENIELAEEHIKIAGELVEKEAIDLEGEKREHMKRSVLELEKAEAELEAGVEEKD